MNKLSRSLSLALNVQVMIICGFQLYLSQHLRRRDSALKYSPCFPTMIRCLFGVLSIFWGNTTQQTNDNKNQNTSRRILFLFLCFPQCCPFHHWHHRHYIIRLTAWCKSSLCPHHSPKPAGSGLQCVINVGETTGRRWPKDKIKLL